MLSCTPAKIRRAHVHVVQSSNDWCFLLLLHSWLRCRLIDGLISIKTAFFMVRVRHRWGCVQVESWQPPKIVAPDSFPWKDMSEVSLQRKWKKNCLWKGHLLSLGGVRVSIQSMVPFSSSSSELFVSSLISCWTTRILVGESMSMLKESSSAENESISSSCKLKESRPFSDMPASDQECNSKTESGDTAVTIFLPRFLVSKAFCQKTVVQVSNWVWFKHT